MKLKESSKKANSEKNGGQSRVVKKALPKKREVDVTVVGCKYRLTTEELSQIAELIDVEPIPCTLEREPENEVDPLAIRVVALDPVNKRFTGRHIGYVQRPTNEPLTKLFEKRG
jgi:hypothetical protein